MKKVGVVILAIIIILGVCGGYYYLSNSKILYLDGYNGGIIKYDDCLRINVISDRICSSIVSLTSNNNTIICRIIKRLCC